MPKYISIKEFFDTLTNMNLLPGTLIKINDCDTLMFWKRGPKPALIQSITDANENVYLEFLAGQNGVHKIAENKPFMFLGLIPIETSTKKGYKAKRKQYYALQFLDENIVVFWDHQVLDGFSDSLKNIFKLAKPKSHG